MRLRVLATGVDRLELSVRGWERTFLVQGHGRRAYPYVLQGANYGLTVRPNGELPPMRVDIYSAWLHATGAAEAATEVAGMLRAAVFVVPPDVVVSRVDIYADMQGCEFRPGDLGRFVTRARERTTYHMGQRFTGFRFGRGGPILVRVYDKTAEIERQGETWPTERWGERRDAGPVWRVELQVRRPVLAEFGLRSPGEVLASVQ